MEDSSSSLHPLEVSICRAQLAAQHGFKASSLGTRGLIWPVLSLGKPHRDRRGSVTRGTRQGCLPPHKAGRRDSTWAPGSEIRAPVHHLEPVR